MVFRLVGFEDDNGRTAADNGEGCKEIVQVLVSSKEI